MAAVKQMIDRIASGGTALPAPGALHTINVSDTAVTLAWTSVAGATVIVACLLGQWAAVRATSRST